MAQHHSQAPQSQQQLHESNDFVHFHSRINGNSVVEGRTEGAPVQPSDNNNNPVGEDLKETINNMLAEGGPLAASITGPVPTTSNNMDPGGHMIQQQQTNQYIASSKNQCDLKLRLNTAFL